MFSLETIRDVLHWGMTGWKDTGSMSTPPVIPLSLAVAVSI